MNWRSIQFDWNRARAFLVTAEEGSLSAAAKALDLTQPTLGRQVAGLEAELGVALFERRGRGLELTPSGLQLLEQARAMGEAAGALSLAASGQSQQLEGTVCVSATAVTATFVLPGIVRKLRRLEPGIEIEIIGSDSSSDLKGREADIAVRAFRPAEPDLIARRLDDLEATVYAAHEYLDLLGRPSTVAEIAKADFIGFEHNQRYVDIMATLGLDLSESRFPVQTSNHLVHWELIRQGVAIGVMPTVVGDADPLVTRALPELTPLKTELWLVVHREVRTSYRVRWVFDFLAEEINAAHRAMLGTT